MANYLGRVLARFDARVRNNENRLVSIPTDVQRQLRLIRRADNHLLLYSIRPKGQDRWHHHWSQLTFDNEFAVPPDVAHIEPGAEVEVKIHRVVKNIDAIGDGGGGPARGVPYSSSSQGAHRTTESTAAARWTTISTALRDERPAFFVDTGYFVFAQAGFRVLMR